MHHGLGVQCNICVDFADHIVAVKPILRVSFLSLRSHSSRLVRHRITFHGGHVEFNPFFFSFAQFRPPVCLTNDSWLSARALEWVFWSNHEVYTNRVYSIISHFFFLFNSRTKSYDPESIPTTQKKIKFDERILQQNKEEKNRIQSWNEIEYQSVVRTTEKKKKKNSKQKSKYSVSITHSTSNHNKSKNRCPDANTESKGTRKMCAHPDTSFTSTPSKMLVDRIH